MDPVTVVVVVVVVVAAGASTITATDGFGIGEPITILAHFSIAHGEALASSSHWKGQRRC